MFSSVCSQHTNMCVHTQDGWCAWGGPQDFHASYLRAARPHNPENQFSAPRGHTNRESQICAPRGHIFRGSDFARRAATENSVNQICAPRDHTKFEWIRFAPRAATRNLSGSGLRAARPHKISWPQRARTHDHHWLFVQRIFSKSYIS